MSNLQRDILKKKLEEREDALRKMGIFQDDIEEDEEQETDSLGDLGMPPPNKPVRRLDQQTIASLLPSASKSRSAPIDAFKRSSTTNSRYKPTSWEEYFEENFTVTVELEPDQQDEGSTKPAKKIDFDVYFTAPSNPETMPVFAFHHGAGSSGLSFAVSAKAIKEVFASDGAATSPAGSMAGIGIGSLSAVAPKLPTSVNQAPQSIPGTIPLPGSGMPATVYPGTTNVVSQIEDSLNSHTNKEKVESLSNKKFDTPGVLAFDIRYHGKTKVYNKVGENEYKEESPEEMDMYIKTLSKDFINVINAVYELKGWGNNSKIKPPLVLIGHSLGGSVVTSTSLISKENESKPNPSVLNPTLVTSVTGVAALDVVEGTAVESLNAMSMILDSRPSSFESVEKAIEWHTRTKALRNLESAKVSVPSIVRLHDSSNSTTDSRNDGRYEWVTDLRKTEPFWNDWFVGLSEKFLRVPAARLLVLAGTDRLDKELMIGQMQGKYQLVVFQDAGHFVQEDVPQKMAHLLYDFWERNNKTNTIVPVFGSFRKD